MTASKIHSLKAISYTRVSTEDQANTGVSLAAQQEKIRQYAGLYGLEIVEAIQDAGFSAKNTNRPGMQRLLSLMEKKAIEAVIVAKLDRLTRNIRDLADIVELANRRGIALVSVGEHIDTGSAAGRMAVNMIGVISQWEREAIGERTAAALRYKRDSGRQYNKEALYGFRHEQGRLVRCEQEQGVILQTMAMRASGLSYGRIAGQLNARKVLTRTGAPWHAEQIRRVVDNAGTRDKITESHFETLAA